MGTALGRASYIFNPTIPGIEAADAILIVGANPRTEASLLNVRIRKRWRGDTVLPVGVIGDVGDLRYGYEQLGAGTETLKDLADGNGKFFQTLKKAAKPLVIVGQGALARAERARHDQAAGSANDDPHLACNALKSRRLSCPSGMEAAMATVPAKCG